MPTSGDLQLAEPEIVRKGGRYGVRLKASAKAIHMFQTNIETEVSPEIGGENASSEILGFLLQGFDGDVEQLWQSNIFGKPIYTIAQEGVEEKLSCLPTKAVSKLQGDTAARRQRGQRNTDLYYFCDKSSVWRPGTGCRRFFENSKSI